MSSLVYALGYFLLLPSTTNSMSYSRTPNKLFRYDYLDTLSILDTFVQYSHQKMVENQKLDPLNPSAYELWHTHNINAHRAIKYAKRKEDRAIYFGWKEGRDARFLESDAYTDDVFDYVKYVDYGEPVPDLLAFFEVASEECLEVSRIIQNPSKRVSILKFKASLYDIAQSGVQIDLSRLKDYDNGRWHLDLRDAGTADA